MSSAIEITVALDALDEDRRRQIRKLTYERGRIEVVLDDESQIVFRGGRWIDVWLAQMSY